jgi:N-methylhydantoinase A/oxoprolinase/acetone carboxylase beta subunit
LAASSARAPILIGIDTGGTFTDLMAFDGSQMRIHKVLSTPADPARAVLDGLKHLIGDERADSVTYGSTVATNALLEKKGARVALITNAGFEDLIEIGRQNRSDIYALAPERPVPLVARSMRWGLAQRTLFDGSTSIALADTELAEVARRAHRSKADSFAVCLLNSYANKRDEEAIGSALRKTARPVSLSHRILAEYREFERLSTTVVNAYVAPKMASHLRTLWTKLKTPRLRVMQSDGNAIDVSLASDQPVRTILSGPAAGVIGAANLAQRFGVDRFITFDMGGTSTDVSLFDAHPRFRSLSHPSGYAVRTPVIDIHTVGAGGGSIARIDEGGSLKVGPQSAGADPGPACYGRGALPTVTDADLIVGRLIPGSFLGGAMALEPARAEKAIGSIARSLQADSISAARGVIRVVNANMERAIRLITVERGFDPREFALLAFGGAGPMHACELASDLGIRHIVLPRNPGLLCAYGALCAKMGRELSVTILKADPTFGELARRARPMAALAARELRPHAEPKSRIATALSVDMRYRGQSYEIQIALTPRFVSDFHAAYQRMFGYSAPEAAIEVVNLRVRCVASEVSPPPERFSREHTRRCDATPSDHAPALVESKMRRVPVYDRDTLTRAVAGRAAQARLRGAMIIVELSATAYVGPDWGLRIDDYGNIHLELR